MSILTLGLGKQTGWAILHNGVIHSGNESFHPNHVIGDDTPLLSFRKWLDLLEEDFPIIEEVYFEEVRGNLSTNATRVHGDFLAHLTVWCKENSIPYKGIPAKTTKRFITGNGNASTADVTEALEGRDFYTVNDSEASALALMFCTQRHLAWS